MRSSEFAECIRKMPKAELHLHFEGAFRWSTVRELNPGARALPDPRPWLGKRFTSFDDFRAVFRNFIQPATGSEERIERHIFEVLEDLARQNVRYVEPILYLPFHMAMGLSVPEVLSAVRRGIERGERAYPIRCRLILGLVRGRSAGKETARAREALELAGPGGWGLVAGLDVMDDDRLGIDPEFSALYREARRMGLRLKVHAGEYAGPQAVREALEKLDAGHFSHGVRTVEDSGLLRELSARGVWFHTCPTSNVLLGVAPDYSRHPIKRLIEAGCNVTLNSDDPLLFGATITDEFLCAAGEMGLSGGQIKHLALNGFRASLLPQSERAKYEREIEGLFA
ncbi:MAG: adenosine deaminase [Betaproteobacteria bacterium]|nr:adenosine deaminase [Betaproteobacteria bacterium]